MGGATTITASTGDGDRSDVVSNSSITTQDLQQPILVGYAFGPKKMSTMATVMAEASRARVVGVVDEEEEHTTRETAAAAVTTVRHKKHALTTAALSRHHEQHSKQDKQDSFRISSPAGGSLNNIVRYFRSSCSSVGSDDTFSNTSTTGTTLTRHSSHSVYHPVRVSFVPVNLNEPLEEQHGGRFDILLHKMTEDILCLSTGDEDDAALQQAMVRIHRLQEYQRTHPQCCLADDPDNVKVVMSRSAISSKLQQALIGVTSASGWTVATPTFCNYDGDNNHQHNLRYPLIAKPLPAAGTKKSHCMGIVLNPKGLPHVNTPCLLQEYANHDGTLYKVYVLGDDIHVFCRPSLPNLPSNDRLDELEQAYVEFDSQRPYPKLADFGLDSPVDTPSGMSPSLMTATEVAPIVQALKRAFGLELFGFDILVSSSSELLVVDVNYFPSFKEVSNFPSLLAKFLVQRAVQTRKVNSGHPATSSLPTGTTPTRSLPMTAATTVWLPPLHY